MVNLSYEALLAGEELMPYRAYPPAGPLLLGYDPEHVLPADHLARLVDQVVEEAIAPPPRPVGAGQPPFDPRLPLKVLLYGYATGQRSSRQLARLCRESLPYLFLTRGDAPSHQTLCVARGEQADLFEQVFVALFAVAEAAGMKRLGHLVIDSSKLRADASSEAVLEAREYEAVRAELQRMLQEAQQLDEQEAREGRPGETELGQTVAREQMRDVVRRVRRELAAQANWPRKSDARRRRPPRTRPRTSRPTRLRPPPATGSRPTPPPGLRRLLPSLPEG
jgi:transposase